MTIPDALLARIPTEQRNRCCICENCVAAAQETDWRENSPGKLLPGDFYMDTGLVVLTASYLRRRGYCCGSGCRHCPYQAPT